MVANPYGALSRRSTPTGSRAPCSRSRREKVQGPDRSRDPRRGRRALAPEPALPVVRLPRLLEGRQDARRAAEVAVPEVRGGLLGADGDGARVEQQGAPRVGALHHLHVLQRAGRPGCGGVRHRPYHGLRVAPPRLRHRGRLPGPPGAEGARLDRRALPHRLRHRPQRGLRAQEGPVEEQDLHRGGHRRLQERRRGHMRPRQALLKAHQGRAAVAHSARFRHRPRHGEGPHEPREGRQVHRRGVQGRREGPCVPGGDGAREQPVLVAQALPIPLPRDEEGQPAVLPELVRVPVPRPTRRGEMAQNGKGHAPFAYDRCALPQLKVGIGPARFATLGIINSQ